MGVRTRCFDVNIENRFTFITGGKHVKWHSFTLVRLLSAQDQSHSPAIM
jgi:hypothetical protein